MTEQPRRGAIAKKATTTKAATTKGTPRKTTTNKTAARKSTPHAARKPSAKTVTVRSITPKPVATTTGGMATSGKSTRRTGGVVTALSERTGYLVDSLGGGTRLAGLLGVSKSQPTRWRKGEEQPSPAKALQILDLDHVVARASLLWGSPDVVTDWLEGPNQLLEGARPIDVLQIRGVTEVLAALEAETQRAFG